MVTRLVLLFLILTFKTFRSIIEKDVNIPQLQPSSILKMCFQLSLVFFFLSFFFGGRGLICFIIHMIDLVLNIDSNFLQKCLSLENFIYCRVNSFLNQPMTEISINKNTTWLSITLSWNIMTKNKNNTSLWTTTQTSMTSINNDKRWCYSCHEFKCIHRKRKSQKMVIKCPKHHCKNKIMECGETFKILSNFLNPFNGTDIMNIAWKKDVSIVCKENDQLT